MDAARYVLALILTVTLPPVILFWLLIHPFVGFWRKRGPLSAYLCVFSVMGVAAAGLVSIRDKLLMVEYGTNPLLIALSLILMGVALWLRVLLQRQFSNRRLMGLPELAPERYQSVLVMEGIYSRIRHPRYVELLIAFVAYALFCNFLATYVVAALWLPGMYVIVLLEERELRERFGAAYEDYCSRVPRFIPHFRGTKHG